MKRLMSLLICLALLMSSVSMAETFIDGGEDRGIVPMKLEPNEWTDTRISPTTGRVLSGLAVAPESDPEQYNGFTGLAITGRYMPMLVQIDNSDGGIGYSNEKKVGNVGYLSEVSGKVIGLRAPWGLEYADVIYEAPLRREGDTRITALFSDIIPNSVGPLRSARLFHAWLREEWDCGFVYYGQQEYTATNVPAAFKALGADKKGWYYDEEGKVTGGAGLLFLGTSGGKSWKLYFESIRAKKWPGRNIKLQKPHDKVADVAALSTLIIPEHQAANHTWLFTDEEPDWDDDAEEIYVKWGVGNQQYYNSYIMWDEDEECYIRYMYDADSEDIMDTHEYRTLKVKNKMEDKPIYFDNIIVQFTQMDWMLKDAPYPGVTVTGNADYFQCGMHMAGVWRRDSMTDRTVFYDDTGAELQLQRGRTLIIVMDYQFENRSVSYE